jgi:6-phosphogluconolactonase
MNHFQRTVVLTFLVLGFVVPVRAELLQVYFGTGGRDAKGIYGATFDTKSGKLSPAELAAEVGSPGFLALHPDGDKVYAVANTPVGPGVMGYRIGSNGSLSLINSSPTGDGGGAHIAVHPSGKFLLTAQYGGGSVALFPLDGQGRLGAATLSEHTGGSGVVDGRQYSPHPHYCGFSPDGRFALVPDLGLDGIVIYRLNPENRSMERHGFAASVPGGGPRHLRLSPDGRFIYLLNELALSVTIYEWNAAEGIARQLNTIPTLSEAVKAGEVSNSAAEILVHPNGRFVYCSNRGNDSVTVYRANPETSALEVIQVQPIRGALPRNIALSPQGGWLLAAGADSNTVAVHQVDPDTGKLTFQPKGVINVPAPICILFVK